MDAWWPRLVDAEFGPALGPGALEALKTVLRPASVLPGDDPAAPDYDDGWWGFVSKDVRDALIGRPTKRNRARARRAGIRVRHAWSRRYCGQGRLARCRTALQDSLREALAVTPAQLYGTGDCASTPDAHCFDLNRAVIASGVDMPPAPFQNRPTFQQTVELTRRLPR